MGPVIDTISWDKDFANFEQEALYARRPSRRPLSILIALLGAALIAIPAVGFSKDMPLSVVLLFASVGGYLLITPVRSWVLVALDLKQALRRDPELRFALGPTTVGLTPDGLTVQSPVQSVAYSWLLVTEIEANADWVVFKMGKWGITLVPAWAFESTDRMSEFSSRATELLQEWRSRQESVPHRTSAST